MRGSSRLAKLSIPRTAGALTRPRLDALLDSAVARGAVWIAAGPGAGKSTLAATWGMARAGRLLWLRADEDDADPAVVFAYFRQLAADSRRSRRLPLFSPRDVDRLDVFARAFFRAFYAVVPAASTLVVDDVHAASGDAFNALLAAAIREAPPDVALVALSRQDPDGPLLDEVTSGRLQLFDGAALAFDPEEAALLLSGRVDVPLVKQLHARTDGWAAGMLLLAQTGTLGTGANGVGIRVAAYFDERVLAPFDARALRILAVASLLPEVDEASLSRLGLDADAVDLLERLRRRNAFVVRLDRHPPCWRLHDLLRDALRTRWHTLGDPMWRTSTLLAAAALAVERDHVRDAVRLHVEAGEHEAARRVAEDHSRSLVRTHRLVELDAVVAALAPDEVARSLPVQFALGESAWQRNDSNAAVERFEHAYGLLTDEAPSLDGLLLAASALTAIFEGWQSYAGAARWADRLRHHLAARDHAGAAHDRLRVDRVWLQTADQLWDDSLCDRPALFDRVLATLRDARDEVPADEIVATSSALIESSGYNLHDERRFQATVAVTAPWLDRYELSPLVKALWLTSYAALGRHWPTPGVKLPAAGGNPSLELAYELARTHGGHALAFIAADFLVNAAASDNDLPLARLWLERQRESSDPRHVVQTVQLTSTEAAVLGLAGQWERAEAAFDRADALAREHGHPQSDYWSRTLGRYRVEIARGNAARAREALSRIAPSFPEGIRRDFALILADVANAACALQERDTIPREVVERIMERASAYNWRGLTILLVPLVGRICAEALRLGIEVDFARRLIRQKHLPAPSAFEPDWPWPVRIHALGGLRILVDDRPLAFGPRAQRKPLDLVKAIIAHGPAPVDSAIVLDALWPDAEGAAARASFDMTLMRLRKLLGREDALVLDAGRVGFDLASVWVDSFAFAHGTAEQYPGPLFGNEAVMPWWAAARERLHQRFLRRTLERGLEFERTGEIEAALAVYEAGLAQDPLAEDLYQGAIRCHVAQNRPADALRVFRRCRDQLSIILSVAPSPATAALVASLHIR
jgi:DNA-binding SARP family transcriptional activator